MCTTGGELCTNCAKAAGRRCSNCHKASYCSSACQKSDWSVHRNSCFPVIPHHVGIAGRGLIATRKIQMGELILRETACVALPQDLGIWEAGESIFRQVSKLPKCQREEFYKLTRKKGLLEVSENLLTSSGSDPQRISMAKSVANRIEETAIFFNNDIKTEDDCKCLFLQMALTNHSCCPNSSWTGCSKNPRHLELRAAKEIAEGEEVTVNYIIVEARFLHKRERMSRLLDGWGFSCVCPLCDQDPHFIQLQEREEQIKSDIRKIQQEMTQECDRNPALVSWKLLCSLQREIVELVSQLVTAQLLLFREYNSLVHLSQLARDKQQLKQSLEEWEVLLKDLNVDRAWKDYKSCLDKLELSVSCLESSCPPKDEEIRQFLWLM